MSHQPNERTPILLLSFHPEVHLLCQFAVSTNFNCVPKLRASGSVSQSPSSNKPDHCSLLPLTLGSPSFSKPRCRSAALVDDLLAAHVSKPTHSAPLAPSSSSEAHGRPPISPLTYLPQSNSNSQPLAPRSVTSSSLLSDPGSTASVPSSPSKSNVEPHPLCMAHNVIGIRNCQDTTAVCCSALIRLAGH